MLELFDEEMEVRLKGREFRICSRQVLVAEETDTTKAETIFIFHVWEGESLLNKEELEDFSFDFYRSHAEAIDGGFNWLRKYVKEK